MRGSYCLALLLPWAALGSVYCSWQQTLDALGLARRMPASKSCRHAQVLGAGGLLAALVGHDDLFFFNVSNPRIPSFIPAPGAANPPLVS